MGTNTFYFHFHIFTQVVSGSFSKRRVGANFMGHKLFV